MKSLLFLAHRIPYPPVKGDKLRSYHFLRHLARHFRVHLGCFVDDPGDWQHVEALRTMCEETCVLPLRPWIGQARSLIALSSRRALSVGYYRDGCMQKWVDSVLAKGEIESALIFSSVMAQYVEGRGDLHRVADFVDVDSQKWAQYAENASWPKSWLYRREAAALLAYEERIAEAFDATVFVSQAEADLFRGLTGAGVAGKIWHAGNGVDTSYFDPSLPTDSPFEAKSPTLVFTGAMDYKPNVEAVVWFAQRVLPEILRRFPDVRFAIVGAHPDAAVRALARRPAITVTGTVPDVRPYLAHAAAVVAPLRIARGVQNKVLEGMAMARPVIASPAAAEGIDAELGGEILIADTASEYLAALQAVFAGTYADVGRRARERILKSYSWVANIDRIRALLEPAVTVQNGERNHAAAAA